jgi:hypothetical protein
MAIMPSEYIKIIAAGIYAVALFYTVVTFRRTKRSDQITQINIIMTDLRNLDLEIEKISSRSDTMILGVCGSGILAYLIL